MPKAYDTVFVLWGERFEETTAVIFVTELRNAGIRVKVVGLTAQRISGTHGIALVPDISLEEAVAAAAQASAVILPGTVRSLKRLRDDPRLGILFRQAQANGAVMVVSAFDEQDLPALAPFVWERNQIMIYPASEDLAGFVRDLTNFLSTAHF
jgi:putative intracellular protease/amidase